MYQNLHVLPRKAIIRQTNNVVVTDTTSDKDLLRNVNNQPTSLKQTQVETSAKIVENLKVISRENVV